MSRQASTIFGIDLGTTYSCISYVDEHGKPVVIPNQEHRLTTPSVVLFEGEQRIVGEEARQSALLQPLAVVEMVKRHMGDTQWRFTYQGQEYTPEEISSYILRKLVSDAQIALNTTIHELVITCPAYFGLAQREATAKAGEIAGLAVREVINEPTAAALAYGLQNEQDQVVLVYDLGGGTFDVTMIEIKRGAITVIATGGDANLGGRNWDEALVLYLAQQWQSETGSMHDPTDDPETLQDLWLKAERAKCTLTTRNNLKVVVSHAGLVSKIPVSRAKFEELTSSLIERTLLFTQVTMDEARERGYKHVDQILLVGGSTRMPQVSARLEAALQLPVRVFDPDEAVARGAALYAQKLLLDEQAPRKKNKTTATRKTGEIAEPQTVPPAREQTKKEPVAAQSAAPAREQTKKESVAAQPTAPLTTAREDSTNDAWESEERSFLPTDLRSFQHTARINQEDDENSSPSSSRQEANDTLEKLSHTTITNVSSHSFGVIVTVDQGASHEREVVENLVLVNQPLPALRIHTYGTLEANQQIVEIRIVENTEKTSTVEMKRITPEAEIGKVILPLPSRLPAHAPIEVTFEINQQGRLHVVGCEPSSKTLVEATFESGLSQQEVNEARSRSSQLTIL